jgi:TolA-binding protein
MSSGAGTTAATLVGMILTAMIGYSIGKSRSQERIEALQREILRIQRIDSQRNAEVAKLRKYVATFDAQLHAIGLQRDALDQFVDWLTQAHPDVLDGYRGIQRAEARIAALTQQSEAHRQEARAHFAQLQQQYPAEATQLLATHHDFLS